MLDITNLTPEQLSSLRKQLGIGLTETDRFRQREEAIGTRYGYVKVTQINASGKEYFCSTPEEEQIFIENHPDSKTETFKIELPNYVAESYLNDPENKEHFRRKGK